MGSHHHEEHSELAGMRYDVLEAAAEPDRIHRDNEGELLAVKEIESGKFLVVVYREKGPDGFIITSFMTRRTRSLNNREVVWSAQK